ncbi:MAG TPA: DUF2066 domain-containing protein [Stellaceae bacterium]|nr:DUF2066 domain-containing protein [Stellaceae bacterium]
MDLRSASVAGRRGAALALALFLGLLGAAPRAAADDDPFTATVTVDATSDSAAKARDIARMDGARRALNAVVERLAGGAANAKPLKLSDNQVTDLVASFEVANEKMSAVRYVADYTYHFKQAELRKALQSAGIAIAADATAATGATTGSGKSAVVLPVYQDGAQAMLWDDPNPWRQAWSQRPAAGGGTTLLLPLGDVSDLSTIDADKARSGDAAALAAIGKKEGADDVLVMLAVPRAASDKPGVDVTVRRYRAGQFVDVHTDSIDANAGEGEDALMQRAVGAIAADLDNGWKNAKDTLASQQGSLVVVAPITSLEDWIKLREGLSGLPAVRKLDLRSLSRQEATVEIQYVGTLDQLKASLASIKLGLEGGDPVWRLARSGAG